MNGDMAVLDIQTRLQAFKESDTERESLVSELVRRFESLQSQYKEKCEDLAEATETRRMWSTRAIAAEALNKQSVREKPRQFGSIRVYSLLIHTSLSRRIHLSW